MLIDQQQSEKLTSILDEWGFDLSMWEELHDRNNYNMLTDREKMDYQEYEEMIRQACELL